MKFTPNFRAINLDLKGYMGAMDGHLTRKLREGGRKWLDATVRTRTHIPTWSGASRAAFQKLAQELGTSIPIGLIRARRSRVYEGYASGARSGLRINPRQGKWQFEFITDLPHLIYNESNPPVPGRYPRPWSRNVRFTPYKLQDKGHMAWGFFAMEVRLPNPYKYLSTRRI